MDRRCGSRFAHQRGFGGKRSASARFVGVAVVPRESAEDRLPSLSWSTAILAVVINYVDGRDAHQPSQAGRLTPDRGGDDRVFVPFFDRFD